MMTNTLITHPQTSSKIENGFTSGIDFNMHDMLKKIDVQSNTTEVLFITSYPPRECGIATYSEDLINAINGQFESTFVCSVCALETNTEQINYKNPPKYILNTDQRNAFAKTAFLINRDEDIDIVMIQHEFGFFEEHDVAFKQFYESINKPIIFVFHRVLPDPNYKIFTRVNEMIQAAAKVVVMTKNAQNLLIKDYVAHPHKISVIPHGTHLVPAIKKDELKEKFDLSNKKIVTTFGLLNAGKGIELTLDALPAIVKEHPNVLFLIIGKTHPTVVKKEGEKYRQMLEDKVEELNLGQYVRFLNGYLPLPKLLDYLQLTDIYLFTSKDPFQAVSGTFAYAMSCGCPIISTPIPFAKEFISENTGRLIDFDNSMQLGEEVIKLLSDDKLRIDLSLNCIQKMAATSWSNTAIAHGHLFQRLSKDHHPLMYKKPEFSLNHYNKMTTEIGFVQFAKGSDPDLNSGYTLDDNARALIVACQYFEITKNPKDLERLNTYFQFIVFCFQENNTFLNYVNEDKKFTSQNFSENINDSSGRAIWALGYMLLLKEYLPPDMSSLAENIIIKALPNLIKIHSTRTMAFIIKGLHLQNDPENFYAIKIFADRLLQMYLHEKDNDWHWFESYLTYANSLLPEAMLCAYVSLDDDRYKWVAKESFDFLISKIFINGHLKVISNNGWHYRHDLSLDSIGGEQPIDIGYTIIALEKFYRLFGKDDYAKKADIAFSWFLGDNHLQQNIYNHCTAGCYDGIEEFNININQGAESTLSYLLSRLTMEKFKSKKVNVKQKMVLQN